VLGIKKGDGVAIDMTMTAESVAVYLGIIKAGAATRLCGSVPDAAPALLRFRHRLRRHR